MNTSTIYSPTERNPWPKIVTLIAAAAAAVMILAGIAAEAASRGVSLQFGAPESPAACRVADDALLPLRLQAEMRAQCEK
jgi:hypothetical protein